MIKKKLKLKTNHVSSVHKDKSVHKNNEYFMIQHSLESEWRKKKGRELFTFHRAANWAKRARMNLPTQGLTWATIDKSEQNAGSKRKLKLIISSLLLKVYLDVFYYYFFLNYSVYFAPKIQQKKSPNFLCKPMSRENPLYFQLSVSNIFPLQFFFSSFF